jgi:aspartyl-tRNA(Asn)/glutamyl-tRNA(Gln) amidotransferase subunit C
MAKITRGDVLHVAKLAKLHIEENNIERFTEDLNKILDHIDKLNEIDTEKVEATSHVLNITNVFRDDTVNISLNKEQALNIAPLSENDHFKVPKIIES